MSTMSAFQDVIQCLQGGLIVSCQAPVASPMHDPFVIAAMAGAAINQGAAGVRIDTPAHINAVRRQTSAPMIGLWKQPIAESNVYITPNFRHAEAIAQAGADIIAIDATLRARPDGETVASLVSQIHTRLGKPVMADVDTLEAAIAAVEAGADLVGTTLYGYTAETQQRTPPGFDLLTQLVQTLTVPVICEGGITSPQMARQALELGANAVVVGTAITGVDLQVKAYSAALHTKIAGETLATDDRTRFIRCNDQVSYRSFINTKLDEYGKRYPGAEAFFTPEAQSTRRPLEILLLNEHSEIVGGLIASTSCWQWLIIDLLWIDEHYRRQGYGQQLLKLAELEAKQRGCSFARLSTLSFQARGFYEKSGYRVVGQVDDYPPGHTQYLMTKKL